MEPNEEMNVQNGSGNVSAIWIGVAVGAAIGLAYAASSYSRKRNRWTYKNISRRVAESGGDLADSGKNILERIQIIVEEGRKVVEEAADLWEHGRRLVRS